MVFCNGAPKVAEMPSKCRFGNCFHDIADYISMKAGRRERTVKDYGQFVRIGLYR